MNENDPSNPMSKQVGDAANQTADKVQASIASTQQTADRIADSAASKVNDARAQVAPALTKVTNVVGDGMAKAKSTMNDVSSQVKQRAQQASDAATGYARDEPVKAMLIAAATGAVLMALLKMMVSSRD